MMNHDPRHEENRKDYSKTQATNGYTSNASNFAILSDGENEHNML